MQDYVVTLVTRAETPEYVAETLEDCQALGAACSDARWLARKHAVEFHVALDGDASVVGYSEAVRLRMRGLPVDWCLQRAEGRRKRLLIADMDSTIIGQECLDEMADLRGIKPAIAALTERAMRGELDFAAALRERLRLLSGMTRNELQRVLDERVALNDGSRTLVRTMAAHGAQTMLVSGGFTFFTAAVAARAGFAKHRANEFIWANDGIAGVAEPILGREAKLTAMLEECASLGISAADVLAVGDGANDLAMLKAAGLGVAYYAKPVVAAEAHASVNHTDLTTLLFYQGYAAAEFAHEVTQT